MKSNERSSARWVLIVSVVGALSGGYRPALAADPHPQASARATTRPTPQCKAGTVLLVTLDGVRWQEIFQGVDTKLANEQRIPLASRVDAAQLTPNLHRLMNMGGGLSDIEASGPSFVSLPGYTELLTGRRDAGCANNDCGRVRVETLPDQIARAECGAPVVFSSWSGIDNAVTSQPSSIATSAGRYLGHRAPLERIAEVASLLRAAEHDDDGVEHDDFRSDQSTGEIALAYLQAERPRFAFIGLGETDEYGHRNDYAGYLSALRNADAFIGQLARLMLERNAHGEPTTLIITTDHGRADSFVSHGRGFPESARVWLVAAGAGIEARGLVSSPHTRYLADVAPTIRSLLELPTATHGHVGEALSELLAPTSPRWSISELFGVGPEHASAR